MCACAPCTQGQCGDSSAGSRHGGLEDTVTLGGATQGTPAEAGPAQGVYTSNSGAHVGGSLG